MARTVVGYFRDVEKAEQVIRVLIEQGTDPELINLTWDDAPTSEVNYDNTIEQAPLIAFKEALFGAEINEEDAIYYNKLLSEGDALLAIYVPTNEEESREWEEKFAKRIDNELGKAGAYDREIRKIYSNRAGLTTYPQTRYSDPVGPNKMNQSHTYSSRSPLNNEVSNVIGVSDNTDYFEEVQHLGGRQIMNGVEVLKLIERRAADAASAVTAKEKKKGRGK